MSVLGILKFLFFVVSGGIAFRQFVGANQTIKAAKIAAVILFALSIIFVIPEIMTLFKNKQNNAELLYWESVEKHPNKSLYCEYLKKYPDGQFVKIAHAQCLEQIAQSIPKVSPPVNPIISKSTQSTSKEGWQTLDRYQIKDGLVKDSTTDLMWMRCSLGQTWDGETCKGIALEYKWNDAMKQADSANEEKRQGYNDWRVPTREELKTLVFCNSGLPKTWNDTGDSCDGEYTKPTIKNNIFLNTPRDLFWSSSSSAENNYNAWVVDFSAGYDGYSSKYSSNAVRLVRNGQ